VLPITTNSPVRATFMHWPLSQVRETYQSRSPAAHVRDGMITPFV
jgi:hypothetical protein